MTPVMWFSLTATARMTAFGIPRAFLGVVGVVTALAGGTSAFAQQLGQSDAKKCSEAAQVLRAYDQAVVRSGGLAAQGTGKKEQRQLAWAQLVHCGAAAGAEAAMTIRLTRMIADINTLREMVGPFRNFRDTAVVNAVLSVASDAAASVPARVFALRTMWVLQTGKFWMGYEHMLPRGTSPADTRCGMDLQVVDAAPHWNVGVEPPLGFETALRELAVQLKNDASQPADVRSAASCVLYP